MEDIFTITFEMDHSDYVLVTNREDFVNDLGLPDKSVVPEVSDRKFLRSDNIIKKIILESIMRSRYICPNPYKTERIIFGKEHNKMLIDSMISYKTKFIIPEINKNYIILFPNKISSIKIDFYKVKEKSQ